MNKRKHAQVWGIAGLDEILISKDPLTPGGKTPVRRVLRPGYFGSNVAVGLADQDIHTTLVTAVGRDREGKKVLKFLRNRGVVTCEARLKGRPTAMSHILAGNGDRAILPTQGSASEAWTEDEIPWTLADQKIYDWLALGHLPADKDGRIATRVILAQPTGQASL